MFRRAVLATAIASLAAVPLAQPAAAAAPAVQITRLYYDSPGVDRRSNSSLNAEYVTILNTTRRAITLQGWTIRDKTGYAYAFGPDVVLGAGKRLTLRTGQGDDGTSTVYWNRRQYVWNNDKDTAYLRRADGKLIDSCSYNSTRYDYTNCP
ncbi:lamin tail domain-containing protein [Planobispora rosea]|uniref:lamin tail domain-containing protein n=1 Tax=Planobispora rosea TaxID=35762 RepID=UPI00114CB5EC|nr:lamin tail domain-containing protein [Planobispora rosea]